jgi:hypothetical protein
MVINKFCMLKQYYLVGLITFVIVYHCNAQVPNGPGGVGTTQAASNLMGWFDGYDLNADGNTANNPANGTAVSIWNDKSFQSNNLTQATGSLQPTYSTTTNNGVLFQFSTTANNSSVLNFTTSNNFANGSAFFVLNATDYGVAQDDQILFDDNFTSLRYNAYDRQNKIGFTVYGVSDYTSSKAPIYGSTTLVDFHKSTASNNVTIYENNTTNSFNVATTTLGIPMGQIGKNSTIEGANYLMNEAIVFNTMLNNTERILVENYLASKYGSSFAITTDLYTMDGAAGGNQNLDVAGIGQNAAGDNHVDSQSDIVRVNNPTTLGNGKYLLIGHNNAPSASQVTDLPAGIVVRLSRTWGVTRTGAIGNVDISFDLTNFGAVTPSDLRLIIDTNNDGIFNQGSTTVISGATSVGGNSYKFSGVALNSTTRFTIASVNMETPLPLSFVSFTATVDKTTSSNLLNWFVAKVTSSNPYTIQRSEDAIHWTNVGEVAFNSSNNYSYEDTYSFNGTLYYRIMTTESSANVYSPIVSVNNSGNDEISFIVYPNPVSQNANEFTIDIATILNEALVVVYDVNGNVLYDKIYYQSNDNHITIPIASKFAPGIYYITASSNTTVVRKKLMVVQ